MEHEHGARPTLSPFQAPPPPAAPLRARCAPDGRTRAALAPVSKEVRHELWLGAGDGGIGRVRA
eukprot:scaffold55515_cov26-Tisochrysis_lutea.AAC.1